MNIRFGVFTAIQAILGAAALASVDVVISIPEQKLYAFDEAGNKVATYKVSTAARGQGDSRGSYATPLGKLEVAAKIGEGAPVGAVFKSGRRTGEICKVNAWGRDPIVTRILHLRGLESQNSQAFARCIYIHGTPDERHLGQAVSYGCIRMRSEDVVELFNMVGVGTKVEITPDRVSNLFGQVVRRPVRLEAVASATSKEPPKVAVSTPTSSGPEPKRTEKTLAKVERKQVETTVHEKGSHVRLLETSGLSINFGGDTERSDRPR